MDQKHPSVDKQQPPPYAQAVPVTVPVAVALPVPVPAPGYPPQGYAGQPTPVDANGRPIVNAVPMRARTTVNNANIRRDAQGNALCRKCGAPYPLPAGCTSWRYVMITKDAVVYQVCL
ncbi:hypothetical protein PINS_up011642 [Pythium insidiosum]|nr:hypothetical protein PINS_up011642 [Pythium insidiosum]